MIPHNRPTLGKEEMNVASQVIGSGWLAQGKEVELFENEICDYLELPEQHAVVVNSGTSALYIAILHLDKLIFGYPAYTCSSLRNAIWMANCKAFPLDISRDNPNLDIEIANEKDVDALIIPHTFGIPADVIKSNKLYIEDIAQALGAKIGNKFVGTFGELGILSFSATKLITSGGQGGAIISRNKDLINQIRDYREFDMRSDMKQRFNFQMTDLQASIGRIQLRKLNSFIERREDIFQRYINAGFDMVYHKERSVESVRYRAIIRTDRPYYLISKLYKSGIKAIIPIEEFELGIIGIHPNSIFLTRNTVSLPIYPSLTNQEVDKIILVVKECLCY
jgi:perosamine synthetase